MGLFNLDNFCSFRRLRFEFAERVFNVQANSTFNLSGQMVNKTDATLNIDSLISERGLMTFFCFDRQQTRPKPIQCNGCTGKLNPEKSKSIKFLVEVPEKPGEYFSRIGSDFVLEVSEQNSNFFKLNVIEE